MSSERQISAGAPPRRDPENGRVSKGVSGRLVEVNANVLRENAEQTHVDNTWPASQEMQDVLEVIEWGRLDADQWRRIVAIVKETKSTPKGLEG